MLLLFVLKDIRSFFIAGAGSGFLSPISQLLTAVPCWALVLHPVLATRTVLGTGSAPGYSTRFWKRIRIFAAKIVP